MRESPPQVAPEVLIVGAGPTGLVLALWLRRRGIAVRLIDRAPEPGTSSRALVVHARTLELYRQLGIADDVVARGLPFTAVNLWVRGRHAARAELGAIGSGLTRYPEIIVFPQDEHERLLIDHVRRAGVEVERGTTLVGLEPREEGRVRARLTRAGAEEACEAAFVVGCDGAHSAVREALGIGFPGGTYERMFYVADVRLGGMADDHDVDQLHLALDDADFLAVFPLRGAGHARLIGTVDADEAARGALTWNDVSRRPLERLRLNVEEVSWFSTYRVHHRVAAHFRAGRVFLAGDAAHIHSPVGGQGMNTGIGDAANLAWKLAEVLRGGNDAVLASYEPERIAFARRLVATTDRGFTLVSRDGWLARRVRMDLVPRLLPPLTRYAWFRRLMFRVISQTGLEYRDGPLSSGRAGRVRGGDRLPWVANADGAGGDNHVPLGSLDWQVHVYGAPSPAIREASSRRGLPLHVFPWGPGPEQAGLRKDTAYRIRPDGYVAAAGD